MRYIVFTDLDGTLLDINTYSFSKAKKALSLIKKKKIPLIFCTSKNKLENKLYQKKIGIKYPFIAENGAVIFMPKKTIVLGTNVKRLRKLLKEIEKEAKAKIIGFGDMTVKQIAKDCGLPLKEAILAKKREYTEPFKIIKGNINLIKKLIKKHRLNYTKSARYHYIMGKNDKGKAVKKLIRYYRKKYGEIKTIGLGDSLNDKTMLKAVNKGFLIKNGPKEWKKIILRLLI